MPNEFVARNGIIALNNSVVTGSLSVTQGITGSLFGTSSWASQAISASQSQNATTASYILNAVSSSFATTASNVLGGATNYIPLWNGATSLSSSVLYQSSGNVGIGTTSPTASLHVYRRTTGTTTADRTTPLDVLVLESENTADQEYEGFGQSFVFRGSTYNDSTQRTLGKIIHQINDNSVNTTRGTSLNIQLSTGSVGNTLASRLYIDYNGNIGVGTTSPYNYSTWNFATLNGNGGSGIVFRNNNVDTTQLYGFSGGTDLLSTGYFQLYTSGSARMYIGTTGNIGIGTTSPNAKLEVSGNLLLSNNTSVLGIGNNTALNPYLQGDASNNLYLGTSGSARIAILTNGNVGIGTTSPSYKLHIVGGSEYIVGGLGTNNSVAFTSANRLIFDNDYNDTARGPNKITLYNDSGVWLGGIGVHNDTVAYYTGGTHKWYQATTATNASHLMTLSNTGNLGIGTTSPNAKLDVNGSAVVSGSLTVTDTITAQRIVVQTITSSVDFVTGSTRFGSIISNTHTFTGSVAITGSLTVVGAGITSSLFGTSSWATNAVSAISATSATTATSATSATSATTAGTVTGTSGQLLTKDDRIIEPNSITSGYMQFGFTSWDNNNGAPYADYLHMRSYTDSSGGSDNLVAFRKNAIGMRIWQQTFNSSSAYSSYRDIALVSSSTDNYVPIWTGTTQLINSAIYQSGGSIGIGTTSPGATLEARTTATVNQQLILSNGGTYHTGLIGTSTTTPLSDNNAWGLFGGPNDYLTRIANSLMLIGGSSVPGIGFRFTTSNLNTTGGTTAMYISASGNVGIGTTTPTEKLTVRGNGAKILIESQSDPSGYYAYLQSNYDSANPFVLNSQGFNILGSKSGISSAVGQTTYLNSYYDLSLNTAGFTASAATSRLFVSQSGNVGIGTTTPGATLDVYTTGDPTAFFRAAGDFSVNFRGSTLGNTQLFSIRNNTTSVVHLNTQNSARLALGVSTTTGSGTIVEHVTINSSGNVGIGTSSPGYNLQIGSTSTAGARSLVLTDANYGLALAGGNGPSNNYIQSLGTTIPLYFLAGNSNNANYIFSSTGRMGIGSTSPGAKVHIRQAGSEIPLIIDSSAATSASFTQYQVNSSTGWEVGMAGSGDSYKWFFSYGAFSSANSKFTITNTGDIGVGTVSPLYKLHVVGGHVKLPNNYKLYFGDVAEALGFSIGSDGASNNMAITNNNNATLQIGTGGTSGHIRFTPNSAESVRFTGTGDVGINTTSPTVKLQVNGNTLITGSLTVGQSTTGSSENTLTIGVPLAGGTGEGGQILLAASGGLYTTASMLDNYQNKFRILRGTNAGSDGYKLQLDMHTGQMQLPNYNSSTAFTGTAAANLAVDSSGNVITVAPGGGSISGGSTNYIARWASATTLTTGSLFDSASRVGIGTITPSYTLDVSGDVRATGAVYANANGAMYFRGGDDAELWDINVANTIGIYGQQDSTIGSIKLGSGGGTISGRSSRIGIGTTTPNSTLDVNGNTIITGSLTVITGSIIELQVTNTGVNIGNALNDTHVVSGSLNMPHTASGLIRLQDASVWANSANYTHPQIRLPDYRTGITLLNNDEIQFVTNATAPMGLKLSASIPKVTLDSAAWLQWSSAATNGFTHDVILKRESAGVLAITGSIKSSGGFTGSLQGTSSWAVSASWAPGGSAPTSVTFNRVTGSYTFALTDAGKTVEMSASAAGTYNLTVPPASTTNFADGAFIDVVLYGTGSIQFVTGSGVTFRSANNWTRLGTRYGAATLINIAGDEWYLIGNLNA